MKKIVTVFILFWCSIISFSQLNLNITDTTVCNNTPFQVCANIPPVSLSGLNFDDRFSNVINIGFQFNYFGTNYTQCLISENNFISFSLGLAGQLSSNYTYPSSLSANELNKAIMFPYQDLDVSFGGVIRYMTVGQAPYRRFIVEFCDVAYYSGPCHNINSRNQLILYETTNVIEMHLGVVSYCTNWPASTGLNGHAVEGIKSGNNAFFVANRGPGSTPWTVSAASPSSHRFTPNSSTNYSISSIPYNPSPFILTNQGSYNWYAGNSTSSFASTACATLIPNPTIPYFVVKYTGPLGCGATGNSTIYDTVTVNYNAPYVAKPLSYCVSQLPATWNGVTIPVNAVTSPNYDTVLVASAPNCDTNYIIDLTILPDTIPLFTPVAPICQGTTLAALPTTSINGVTGTWSPILNNSATTTYTFTPSASQCASQATMQIVVNPTVTPTFNAISPICAGENLNPLPTTSINGISGSWSPALDNTATTTYTFTPSNASQCAVSTTLTIVVNPILNPTFTPVSPICQGATLNALPTTSLNGVSGSWSPAINNTTTTTYTFTPNAGQCAVSATMLINVNPILTPAFTPLSPICQGTTLAALPTTSINGVSGTWSPALNTSATTTYTFTPSTGQCASQATMQIVVNPTVTPTFNAINAICAGETLSALPTTSINGVSGSWSPALDNTTTTTYTFTPTNASQCAVSTTLTIVVNPILNPTFTPVSPICQGATLNALPTTSLNGVSGSWSPAINNTTTTTYTFTPNAGQCAVSATMLINVNPILTPAFTPVDSICQGTTLAALPTTSINGVTGTWSPALNNTATTTYTFTPGAGQCASQATMQIVVNPTITPTFNAISPICAGENLNPLPTTSINGISGSWSPALDNTTTTTYTFTPSYASQCAVSTTLTIVVNPILNPTFTPVNPICQGATLNALPTTSLNGVTGSWSPAINNTTTTTYTFTPSVGQCAVSATMLINVNPILAPAFTPVAPICQGTTLAALPTTSINGVTGTWSPALNNTATTTYTFTPSAGQCASQATMQIVVNPTVTPTFSLVSAVCAGSTLNPLPTTSLNGITGIWSPAMNNLATTTYTFTPNAGQNCPTSTTLQVVVNPYLIGTRTIEICQGDSYTFNGVSYTNSISGIKDTISNSTSCDSIITLNLTVHPKTFGTQNATICAGSFYLFNGNSYSANNNSAKDTLTNQWGCDSIVTLNLIVVPVNPVTNSISLMGCGSVSYASVNYTHDTSFVETITTVLGCDSIYKQINIVVFPQYQYAETIDTFGCNSVQYEDSIYINSKSFVQQFKTINGCDSLTRTVNVEVLHFELYAQFSPSLPFAGEQINITTSANTSNYNIISWQPGSLFANQTAKFQNFSMSVPALITIIGESMGCLDTVLVDVGELPTYSSDVKMPNAFSPNGDGRNDVFRPVFKFDRAYTIVDFLVYNRYGQVIFSSGNSGAGWDGYFKGKLQDQGVYYYSVKIRFLDNTEKSFNGDVTLIR